MKTLIRILSSTVIVSLVLASFVYAAPGFKLTSLSGMNFFTFFQDNSADIGIDASSLHSRINNSYIPSPADNFNYIRGKTFLGNDTVVVDASGNVGVGNVSPGQKLDIAGNVNATGYFVSTNGQPASTTLANASGYGAFQAQAQGSAGTAGAALISFHRPSAYAAYFGIDTDNVWKVGGWSMGAVSYPLALGGGYTNPVITGTTPTAAAHLATKAYVDAAVGAAGGGGGVTYLGATSTSYNGNWGGFNGGNVKCQAQYGAGARVMTSSDISKVGFTGSYTNGWVSCDMVAFGGLDTSSQAMYSCASLPVNNYNALYGFNCGGWASTATYYGISISGSGTINYWNACSASLPIQCVK